MTVAHLCDRVSVRSSGVEMSIILDLTGTYIGHIGDVLDAMAACERREKTLPHIVRMDSETLRRIENRLTREGMVFWLRPDEVPRRMAGMEIELVD
jgi:hypothetical protein